MSRPEPTKSDQPVLAVLGPTAVGKTQIAVELALSLAGTSDGPAAEIISADAFQIYRGMVVGTAAPDPAEQRGVPHHLLGAWSIGQRATAVAYRQRARVLVEQIRARGRTPMLVGGSGLYVAATLDELAFPGTDPTVRAHWEAELARLGPQRLHAVLAERDPAAAAAIEPMNGRRLVRALEVVELTGSFTATLPDPMPEYTPAVRVGLWATPEVLDRRIEHRVSRMWEQGLVEEVRGLKAQGLASAPTAGKAIGYAEVLDLLEGRSTVDEAKALVAQHTRQLARRQLRWFRRDRRIQWVEVPEQADAEEIAASIQRLVEDCAGRVE